MKDFSGWLEAAAEESMKMAISSSMDIVKCMRKDSDNKDDIDHDKLDMLKDCWMIIDYIKKVMSHVDGPADGHTNGSVLSTAKAV